MPKTVAILQSNYIPWKGYFDLIARVDEFILYDEVQFTRRDWRNRNRIKTAAGTQWLTIPVEVKGKYFQKIRDVRIAEAGWGEDHWNRFRQAYARAPYLAQWKDPIEELFRGATQETLSEVNERILRMVCGWLGITTPITRSADYDTSEEDPTRRLVSLCLQANADHYLSGPAAKAYMDEARFAEAGIELGYADYAGYPEYSQPHPPFDHAVTVLDLLACTGPEAREHMRRNGEGADVRRRAA